jgi:DNA helicase II / ATP-dependent DNA helicase PcrA
VEAVEDALNPPQAEAVAHVDGPLLVFAGAGSGKTRVITYRVANLVAEARVAPYRILAVTFTNKAAGEMRARLARLLGEELAKELWVGTFHATCARLLRRNGASVGVPSNFVIYDAQDQRTLVTRAVKELDLDEKRYPPRQLLHAIQKEKQEGREPESMRGTGVGYMDDTIRRVFEKYEAQLAAAGAVDFDDLIGKTRRLLMQDDNKLRHKFSHVLVDEFQDTNWLQYELVRLLSSSTRNLCVVGDDDQSIYKWRGADRRNILNFKRDYPDAKVVKLEQNYRSTSRIVQAALAVIEPSSDREPKSLWTANEPGASLDVVAVRDEHEEAALVVQTIREAREAGTELRELAVFYRVHAQSRVLEEQLRAAKVPYRIVGGTKFFERAEIKDALSYLRVMVNDKSDVDLLRVINTPPRGIGQATIDRLTALATSKGTSIYDALAKPEEAADITGAPLKKLRAVRDLLAGMKKSIEQMTPSDALLHVLDTTGYLVALQEDEGDESEARLENLRELVGSVRDYEVEATAAGEEPTIDAFLERVTLRTDADEIDETGSVTLMTVHAAKGLEFKGVIITGMEEDMFPYRSMQDARPDDIDEERRLAYVAITRAREKLMLIHARARQIFGQTRWGRPSRFLGDIPHEVVVHRATRGASTESMRYFDTPARPAPRAGAFRAGELAHPQDVDPVFEGDEDEEVFSLRGAPPPSMPQRSSGEVGGRYVDRDYFSDDSDSGDESRGLRRGAKVKHERFGEGVVRQVLPSADPAVVAFFPAWGEKKVLVRYLRLA